MPHLANSIFRETILRARGACIDTPVLIAPCNLNGPAANLRIGAGTFLGRATLHLHAKIILGKKVIVNDGVTFLTATHDVSDPNFRVVAQPILVGDQAWIATGAVILPGVTIGAGAVIGAAAVVSRSVPEFAIAVGNPARVVGRKRIGDLLYSPLYLVASVEAWLGPAPLSK